MANMCLIYEEEGFCDEDSVNYENVISYCPKTCGKCESGNKYIVHILGVCGGLCNPSYWDKGN